MFSLQNICREIHMFLWNPYPVSPRVNTSCSPDTFVRTNEQIQIRYGWSPCLICILLFSPASFSFTFLFKFVHGNMCKQVCVHVEAPGSKPASSSAVLYLVHVCEEVCVHANVCEQVCVHDNRCVTRYVYMLTCVWTGLCACGGLGTIPASSSCCSPPCSCVWAGMCTC